MNYRFIFFILLFFASSAAFCQSNPCVVVAITHNPNAEGLWSPDSSLYLVNKKDSNGIYQIYIGHKGNSALKCISLTEPNSGQNNWANRHKMQVNWHPSGKWIICAVEKEKFNEQGIAHMPGGKKLLEGWLQCGLWMDIWAVKPDGSKWCLLASTDKGFTGPAFTRDGKTCAWADALDSANMFKEKFGKWALQISGFDTDKNGNAMFTSTKTITPAGARWIEPGNFSPDEQTLLISSDIGMTNAQGQDQYALNVFTGKVVNLTNSPTVWDEHGVFSPDGKKILFMSSYPYRDEKNSYKTLSLKTEFMLMNADGTGLQQLTHFRTPGYPESSQGIAATGYFTKDGTTIYCQSLVFPAYDNWIIKFTGNCGNDTSH